MKKKKQDALRRLSKPELSKNEKDELFWLHLKEALVACDKLFENRIGPLSWEHAEKHPEIRAFIDSVIKVEELLEKLEGK